MTYFTSDQHFGHFNIIRLSHRPFSSVEEMDGALLSRWNAKVRDIKLGHGVYQVKHHVPDVDDPYAIAVAIGGPTAYLRGASVVALLNLAPTSPDAIYIGASGRVRRKLSIGYRSCGSIRKGIDHK